MSKSTSPDTSPRIGSQLSRRGLLGLGLAAGAGLLVGCAPPKNEKPAPKPEVAPTHDTTFGVAIDTINSANGNKTPKVIDPEGLSASEGMGGPVVIPDKQREVVDEFQDQLNDWLRGLVGIPPQEVIDELPAEAQFDKLTQLVPNGHTSAVAHALSAKTNHTSTATIFGLESDRRNSYNRGTFVGETSAFANWMARVKECVTRYQLLCVLDGREVPTFEFVFEYKEDSPYKDKGYARGGVVGMKLTCSDPKALEDASFAELLKGPQGEGKLPNSQDPVPEDVYFDPSQDMVFGFQVFESGGVNGVYATCATNTTNVEAKMPPEA